MKPHVKAIQFSYLNSSKKLLHTLKLRTWILNTVVGEGRELGDIGIAFCSDSYIRAENVKFLSHDYATDILTFSYNEGNIVSGDLLISTDTVFYNSVVYKVPYIQELYRVMIHGVLHLIGYDDTTEELQEKMTEREDYYLAELEKLKYLNR